jgi:hypothetical protein
MVNTITSPARSLLKNQEIISDHISEIENLIRAVGRTGDLWPSQWIQLISFVYEFRPDFILELGRGHGNSTCAFNEVCQLIKPDHCDVLSLCISDDWDKNTAPNLRKIVLPEWFNSLTTLNANILTFDFEKVLKNKKRIVVFWDAHGFDIAEVILGYILPLLKDRPNLIIMHDLSDARYIGDSVRNYGENRIWKGKNDWSGPTFRIGHISSCVEQAIAAVDFCSRNDLVLHSSDESYHTEINSHQMECLVNLLGENYVSKSGHWFWFSLNEATAELTFPKIKVKPNVATGTRSILKNFLSIPTLGQIKQNTDDKDVQQLLNKVPFHSIFDKSGDNLMASLETNFYDETKKENVISKSRKGIYIHPTSPKDHLATPFLPIKQTADGKTKYIKITLGFASLTDPEINCKIFLQDSNFDMISKNLLSDEPLTILKNDCIISMISLIDAIPKIRLIINFTEDMPTLIPSLIKIEQSL